MLDAMTGRLRVFPAKRRHVRRYVDVLHRGSDRMVTLGVLAKPLLIDLIDRISSLIANASATLTARNLRASLQYARRPNKLHET